MAAYNLTQRQKELLSLLVGGVRTKGWSETFEGEVYITGAVNLAPTRGEGEVELEDLEDMNLIAMAGLVRSEHLGRSEYRYTLTHAAFDAVDQGFVIPEPAGVGNQYIGVQVQGNVGGSIQGIGYSDNSEILQIVSDPESLRAELEKIGSALLDAVKGDLHGKQLVEYAGSIENLKETIEKEPENKNKLRELIGALSFVNDTAASFELMAKAWPYISLLLQLASHIAQK